VLFHHGICKIIVLTCVEEQDSWFLLGYSATGELEKSMFFHKGGYWGIEIKSHPSGPVTVAVDESILFI
jgi:hypothetical protein